jgi:hypothetical protein
LAGVYRRGAVVVSVPLFHRAEAASSQRGFHAPVRPGLFILFIGLGVLLPGGSGYASGLSRSADVAGSTLGAGNFAFGASLAASGAPATLTLRPASDSNVAGAEHCVTATVRDGAQNPVPGVSVRFSVTGANRASAVKTTSTYGRAHLCYTGTKAGRDTISAFVDMNLNAVRDAGEPGGTATNTYSASAPATLGFGPRSDANTAGTEHCMLAAVRDAFQNAVPGVSVRFSVSGANRTSAIRTTSASGLALFCYTGTKAGTDTITAFVDADGDGIKDTGEPRKSVTNTYRAAAAATLALLPRTATKTAGTEHCVLAIVRDAFQNPVPSVSVRFSVTGANRRSGVKPTSNYGRAYFCYTGTKAGTDTIGAFADTDGSGAQSGSEPFRSATNTYAAGAAATLTARPAADEDLAGLQHCVTATLRDAYWNLVPRARVRFNVGGANVSSGDSTTDVSGRARFCYTGKKAGSDTIKAFADKDGDHVRDPNEPNGSAAMTWSPPPSARFVGPETMVFDWSQNACEKIDIPDAPARAFRDSLGRVQLIASHHVTRRKMGPSLDAVTHRCGVVMSSHKDPDPSKFNDHEWLSAPYTLDGQTIFALVHMEFQGNLYPGCQSGVYRQCWYNALTSAVSHNAGDSYQHAPAPAHLVASIPYRYTGSSGPMGIFSASNIVKRADGYYYTLVATEAYGAQERGVCLLRTKTLGIPGSWRAWNGAGFGVRFVDPYRDTFDRPLDHVCKPVAYGEIEKMWQSLTYNNYLGKYVLVGASGKADATGNNVYGLYFSYSNDLVHWSPRKLIKEMELPWTYKCGDRDPVAYPSLLDPATQTRNFERTGQRAYLYYTRLHYRECRIGFNRDLVRAPIEFQK